MTLKLNETIRALRKRDGRTQEDVAQALGITFQAVSRWEAGQGYPDMELIPAIAHYFGISIDELFGYESDHEKRVDAILSAVDAYHYKQNGSDDWVDDVLAILREGLAEFPQNERLMLRLADALCEAGWRRHHEWMYYDDAGFMRHDYDRQKKNNYWTEAVKVAEHLVETATDSETIQAANAICVMLYRNFGETERAITCANRQPWLYRCRELALCTACDGREEARYIGEALLSMAGVFANQLVYGLVNNVHHYETDAPIEKLQGAIALFDLLCDDGDYGDYSGNVAELFLYLSRVLWERGYRDDAFASLDKAYDAMRVYESHADGQTHPYTGMLTKEASYRTDVLTTPLTARLPDDWPVWCNPDYKAVEAEIQADPRWAIWVAKCRGDDKN